jgi:hypothetical protein
MLAITDRHSAFIQWVQSLAALQPGADELPEVTQVLRQWWKLRVPYEPGG